jgi:hypothetical protein
MEDITTLKKSEMITGKKVRKNFKRDELSLEKDASNAGMDNLIAEGGENFFYYLSGQGLVNESSLVVLPSSNHYYYDTNELKDVTTLINLKKLNLIKHLDSFINTMSDILSPETNFIGCFSDSKTQKEIRLSSRMYKRFINFLDSKIDNEIDKNEVLQLFESRGYRVVDMTEIDGLTYFRTRKLGLSA